MKVLFIGLGAIGQRHLRNLISLKKNNLEIFSFRTDQSKKKEVITEDLKLIKGSNIDEKFNIKTFSSLKEVLALKQDITFICSPSSMHIEPSIQALKAESHVFIEKPLSNSLEGINKLEKIAKEKNKLVYVGFQMRFNPVVKKLKSLVENKKIGKITSVRLEVSEYMPNFHKYEDYRNSYTSRKELGGGVILSQIHELDYLQWIFGKPNSVLAYGGKISDLEIDVEDSVTALISINKKGEDGNIPISLHMDFLQKNAKRKCIVYGTKGRIEADLIKVKIDVLTDSVEKFEWKEFKRNDQFLAQIKHFLDATEKKVVPLVDLSEGKKSLEIALSLKKSLDSNKIEIIPWN